MGRFQTRGRAEYHDRVASLAFSQDNGTVVLSFKRAGSTSRGLAVSLIQQDLDGSEMDSMVDFDHHFREERLYYFDPQEVVVKKFHSSGFILDIGGGGEGIIGRLKGEKVIAIDLSAGELEGSAPGPVKIIMDCRQLKFLDASFGIVTSFFSLMCVQSFEHSQVFQEVYRVLKPGGRFKIWEPVVPHRLDETRDVAVFPVTIELLNEKISTEYAALWPDVILDMNHYEALANEIGFEIISQSEIDRIMYLELQKH